MSMKWANATLKIPSQVMARAVGDEVVILDLASGTYFGLDAVGTRAWQLFGERRNLGQAVDIMLSEFEVTRDELERDMVALADSLHMQGLLEIIEPESTL